MLFIKPIEPLGRNIECLTLTKKFFDHNAIDPKKEKLFSSFLNYQNKPIQYMDQVHKHSVEAVSSVSPPIKTTDALISTSNDIVLSAVSADCLPITISKQDGSAFAIIHAGWKGLISGVIQSCISSFTKDKVHLSAWIGPSISKKYYEVDKVFYDAFLSSDKASLSNFNKIRSDKWLFSLQGEAHRILKKYDVEVQDSNLCTFENQDLFYSYRRNQTNNRLLTIIWRDE